MKKMSTKALPKYGAALLALSLLPISGVTAANAVGTTTDSSICSTMTTDIHKTVNPKSTASLLTGNVNESTNSAAKYNFTDVRGSLFKASSSAKTGLVPVHRLNKSGDYIYVSKHSGSNEWQNAQTKNGYVDQGVNFYASTKKLSCSIPVYRYLKGSKHRYVTTNKEQTSLKAEGWVNEGTAFYAVSPLPAATAPVLENKGSAPVGTTEYAVPANALIVSPTGSDAAAGSLTAPFQTVAKAISKATSGQTIVLRAGIYNEMVSIPTSKKLTIQSYPKETVWFDGSKVVTDWTQTGTTWTTNWNYFPSTIIQGVADNPRFVDPKYPLASKRDQVFLNGKQLTQVATAAEVSPGKFFADPTAKTITVGDTPAGNEIRISNLSQAIKVNSTDSTLQGFGVRNYGTEATDGGAVKLANVNSTAKNLVIQDNAYIGINVENNNTKLDHLTVERSGLLGVGANASYGFALTNSIVKENNYQKFKPAPVAGGVKITRSRDVTVTNNDASFNHGVGLWFDESVYNINVSNNIANNNVKVGISLELNQKVLLVNNQANNQEHGISIVDTGDVRAFNNEVGNNTIFGFRIAQDERRASDLSVPGHDGRQPLPDPTMPWVTKDIVISNTSFGTGSGYQIYSLDAAPKNITIDGNLFNIRATKAQATLVAWGGPDLTKYDRLDTPAAISTLNSNWTNAQTSSVLSLADMAAEEEAAAEIAIPLPADAAAAAGLTAGSQKMGNY